MSWVEEKPGSSGECNKVFPATIIKTESELEVSHTDGRVRSPERKQFHRQHPGEETKTMVVSRDIFQGTGPGRKYPISSMYFKLSDSRQKSILYHLLLTIFLGSLNSPIHPESLSLCMLNG